VHDHDDPVHRSTWRAASGRGSARRLALVALGAALLVPAAAWSDSDFPVWERLLRWAGGDSSATPVATTTTGHMQMSVRTPPRPGDDERATAVIAAAKRVLERYRDVATAERDGYRAFFPRGVVGEEVHYTNNWKAGREKKTLDLEQPGSILYKRTGSGLVAVGVMYTAPADATPEQLDARLPLSIAVWHRHVDFCGWPNGTPRADWDGPRARFGIGGSIDSEAACDAAGGYWIPLVLGWMTHVYPFETDSNRIWLGEHMMHLDQGGPEHADPVHGEPAAPAMHEHRHHMSP
jgi:hypothetical protein